MQFSEHVSFPVFNDAWETWNRHFRKRYRPKLGLVQFHKIGLQGRYETISLADAKKGDIENLAIERLKAASVQEAYSDRPRGGVTDIQSVRYHMRNTCVSPIVLAKVDQRLILLDGMHRLVAASLLKKRKVPALVIQIV
jgi:hypothetical protein